MSEHIQRFFAQAGRRGGCAAVLSQPERDQALTLLEKYLHCLMNTKNTSEIEKFWFDLT